MGLATISTAQSSIWTIAGGEEDRNQVQETWGVAAQEEDDFLEEEGRGHATAGQYVLFFVEATKILQKYGFV